MNSHALAGTLLAACASVALAASPSHRAGPAAAAAATSASGNGTMSFGHDGDGRGYLRFHLRGGEVPTASLLYAAEDHHGLFPDVIVRLGSVDDATFGTRSVTFTGPGALHDDPVTVKIRAWDHGKNTGNGKADRFAITCTDSGGAVVFEADGDLFRGDIEIGDEEGATP